MHVSAQTEVSEDDVKEEFYTKLQEMIDVHQHDMLMITKDMNAKV